MIIIILRLDLIGNWFLSNSEYYIYEKIKMFLYEFLMNKEKVFSTKPPVN